MHLDRLALTDFRSYAALDVALVPGPCVLLGPNGRGKTNLVEAIGYLATLGSHRVATDAPLVRAGSERAVVRAGVVRADRRAMLEVEINPGKSNRAQLNRSPLAKPRQLLGVLQAVLFAPEDLALVKGDPTERRRFLDDLLVSRAPRMAGVRSDYERVLRQRNALLKSAGHNVRAGRGDLHTLETWDAHLVRLGAELLAARLAVIDELAPLVNQSYEEVSAGAGPTRLDYRSSVGTQLPTGEAALAEVMAAAVSAARGHELDRGVSLVGPHRDDLVLSIGELPARGYASHGESWSLALALRLACFHLLRDALGATTDPVLILDDVFAELDVGRRARLAGLIAGTEQVLITAAVTEDVPVELRGTRYEVGPGTVTRAE